MNPETTAVLFIEYQNDFVSEGGAQHDVVVEVMRSTDMLTNSRALLDAARQAGLVVLHAPIKFADGYPEMSTEPYGVLAGIKAANAFREGSWGANFAEAMFPTQGEIVVEGKRGLDCFASTNLDFILRQRGIKTLAISGFLTNCCVESTMRSAYERGYQVVTVIDCCATVGEEEQRVAVSRDFPMFSLPMTHTAFLAKVAQAEAVAT